MSTWLEGWAGCCRAILRGLAEEVNETAKRIKAQAFRREPRRGQHHGAAAPGPVIGASCTIYANKNISTKKKVLISIRTLALFNN